MRESAYVLRITQYAAHLTFTDYNIHPLATQALIQIFP